MTWDAGGFGSTLAKAHPQVAAITQAIGRAKFKRTYYCNGIPLEGLVDTGADVTVISARQWPSTWDKSEVPAIWGVGGLQAAQQSTRWIAITPREGGKEILLKPYIMDIAVSLWGRDLLSKFGSHLTIHD